MKQNIKASFYAVIAVVLLFTTVAFNPERAQAQASFDVEAESAILVDAQTGKILYAKQPDMKLPPASMTKMMTEYLVLEAIEEGQISWDTTTQISDYPYKISGHIESSGIGLIQNKDYTVRQLYEAMAIESNNGTTIALAELVAGSEGKFVEMMNKKAEEMGLSDYKFVNSTGLPNSFLGEDRPEGTEVDGENLLSAKSTALLAYHLINDYPKALEISSMLTTELDGRNLLNLNWMLPWEGNNFEEFSYEGIDGLKTGYTELAGYCFTGTAEQNGRRLISVVMKTDSKGTRFVETERLMEYGFTQFDNKEVFPAGYQLDEKSNLPVAKGKEEAVEVASNEAFYVTLKEGEEEDYSVIYNIDEEKLNDDGKLIAPLKKGEKIGTVELAYQGEINNGYITDKADARTADLVTTAAVNKANWFVLSISAVGGFFSNVFTSVADTVKGFF